MRNILLVTMFSITCSCGQTVEQYEGDVATDTSVDSHADSSVDSPADTTTDVPVDTPADTTPDGPGPGEEGECESSEDCDGRPCIRVPDEPGGYWLCQTPEHDEATECTSPYPDMDQCCESSECTDGRNGACFFTDTFDVYCGGPEPMDHNVCVYDECTEDAHCVELDRGNLCLPADLYHWPRRRCGWGTCKVASDCPGGYCAPIPDYCCPSHISGFFCFYPGNCVTDEDCEDWDSCVGDWDTGGTRCDIVACPL